VVDGPFTQIGHPSPGEDASEDDASEGSQIGHNGLLSASLKPGASQAFVNSLFWQLQAGLRKGAQRQHDLVQVVCLDVVFE
jgi:hypothetical protein